jgi:hypothetical protein
MLLLNKTSCDFRYFTKEVFKHLLINLCGVLININIAKYNCYKN